MPNPLGRALRHRRAGQHTLAWALPELAAPETFTLTSPAFAHGAPMPAQHRGRLFGPNVSPELVWTAPPVGTAELVLLVEDPDAPGSPAPVHGLTVGIDPQLGGIAEGGLAHPSPTKGLRHGRGAMGHRGYFGPMPLPSHGPHVYAFQLFALDQALELPERFTRADAVRAMAGHVLARARLDGTYEIA